MIKRSNTVTMTATWTITKNGKTRKEVVSKVFSSIYEMDKEHEQATVAYAMALYDVESARDHLARSLKELKDAALQLEHTPPIYTIKKTPFPVQEKAVYNTARRVYEQAVKDEKRLLKICDKANKYLSLFH
jgi:hypothetical protein